MKADVLLCTKVIQSGLKTKQTRRQKQSPNRQHTHTHTLTLAGSTICGVSKVPGDTAFTVPSRCEVFTPLTHTLVHTLAVAVTLARCTGQKNTLRYSCECVSLSFFLSFSLFLSLSVFVCVCLCVCVCVCVCVLDSIMLLAVLGMCVYEYE